MCQTPKTQLILRNLKHIERGHVPLFVFLFNFFCQSFRNLATASFTTESRQLHNGNSARQLQHCICRPNAIEMPLRKDTYILSRHIRHKRHIHTIVRLPLTRTAWRVLHCSPHKNLCFDTTCCDSWAVRARASTQKSTTDQRLSLIRAHTTHTRTTSFIDQAHNSARISE